MSRKLIPVVGNARKANMGIKADVAQGSSSPVDLKTNIYILLFFFFLSHGFFHVSLAQHVASKNIHRKTCEATVA